MPTLNGILGGETVDGQGRKVPLSPAIALMLQGPIVEVSISVAPIVAQTILSAGGTVPPPVKGLGLIDTGASGTCVDDDAAAALQLPVTGTATMVSASHAGSQRNLYPIQLEVVGWPIKMQTNRAMGASLKAQGLVALIGRDILRVCVLVYNGGAGTFSLSI